MKCRWEGGAVVKGAAGGGGLGCSNDFRKKKSTLMCSGPTFIYLLALPVLKMKQKA